MYRIGLKTADRMFGELVEMLAAKGALQNALVIVLSDHGEAMGLPADSFFDEAFHVDRAEGAVENGGPRPRPERAFEIPVPGAAELQNVRPRAESRHRRAYLYAPSDGRRSRADDTWFPRHWRRSACRDRRVAAAAADVRTDDSAARPERIRFTETDLRVLPKSTAVSTRSPLRARTPLSLKSVR